MISSCIGYEDNKSKGYFHVTNMVKTDKQQIK